MSRRRTPEAAPLCICVDGSDPAAPAIRVGGDLAFTTAAPLRAEVDRLLAPRFLETILDITGITGLLDRTGLAVPPRAATDDTREVG
ncbi:hypothetical protein ACGFI9_11900 [Micromonospora sp. NPDC048930]|uniref:hypothetical protein n=1 Tax=Micromonospora sp. NPDC048930 TaxID=3364261 RepID=UPI0037216A76